VDRFIQQANAFHPTIKFTAEISKNEITLLDTVVFKGERFTEKSILDIKTHYKPTETFATQPQKPHWESVQACLCFLLCQGVLNVFQRL